MARVPAFGLVPHRDGQVLPREALRLDDQLQPQNAGFHGPPSLLQWTSLKSFLPATQSEQALGAPAFSPVLPKDHTHQGCPPTCHSQLVTEPSQSPLATPTAHPCCHSGQHVSPWPLPVASASPGPSHITLVICTPALPLQLLHWPLAWGPSTRGCRPPALLPWIPLAALLGEQAWPPHTPHTWLGTNSPLLGPAPHRQQACLLRTGGLGDEDGQVPAPGTPSVEGGTCRQAAAEEGQVPSERGLDGDRATPTGSRTARGRDPGGTPPHIRLKGRAWPAHTAIPASAKDTHCPSLGRRDPSTRASSGGPPTAGAQTRHLASVLALPHRWGRQQGNLGGLPGGSSGITHARRCAGPGTPSTLPRAALPAAAADVTVRLLPATARADGLSTPASRTRAPVPHSAPGLRACGRQASRQECPSLRPTLPPKPSQRPLGEAAPGPHALFCVPPSRPARRPRTGPESSDRGHRGSGGGCKRTVRSPRRQSHPAADQGGQSPPHARAAGGRATPGLSHLPGPRRRASDRVLP